METSIEKIEFVANELKKIAQAIEKSGGHICKVDSIDTDYPVATAKITIVWIDKK